MKQFHDRSKIVVDKIYDNLKFGVGGFHQSFVMVMSDNKYSVVNE